MTTTATDSTDAVQGDSLPPDGIKPVTLEESVQALEGRRQA